MLTHGILRRTGLFIAAGLWMTLLGACNFPDTPEPGCELLAPGIPIEDSQISESLRPTVEWVYDGTCAPDSFRVEFAPEADFGSPQAVVGTTDAGTLTWSPPADLLPMTEYGWRVAAVSGGVIGPHSIIRPLWTGPVCSGPYLRTPRLISPDTGDVVTNPSPEFRWEPQQPDCLVPGYRVDVSTDPAFATTVIHGGTTGPGTEFSAAVDYLLDCRTYFWRVAAMAGMDLMSEYAVDFFRTDFAGACGTPDESATVGGSVWQDECPASGVCGADIPPGCQCVEGGILADGIHQAGEAGVPDVTVHVGQGQCPQAGWLPQYNSVTDADGNFSQSLPPGIYCLWIIETEPFNDGLEKPGRWTRPIPYDAPFGYTVTLTDGDSQAGNDFAWQPAPPGSVLGGIGGLLWRDLDGDGVRDSGEPGIEGTEVWLSSGVCDAEWSNRQGGTDPTTRTDVNGKYGLGSNEPEEWVSLTDGDYCVVVDPNDGWFADIMGEGTWTYPVPNAEIAMTTIQLRGGLSQTGVNFGWGTPSGQVTPQIVPGPTFTAVQDLNCRFGPATVYDIIGYVLKGESAPVVGVNEALTWAQIENPDRAGVCWAALSGGEVAGDLGSVAVVTPPPTPTPKPSDTQAPSVQVSHAKGSRCGSVVYTATASDNVGVTRIKIYLDGALVQTCNGTTSCSFTAGAGSYYATAEDAAGNIATSGTGTAPPEYC